ncbi:hypothetical protein SKAU_G00357990 [Synaphobranchus kaupii]|uniref:Notch-regulated ankyrin repeat-containing protein n=3 Tax=Elopomorpha TaxID=32521 RepID=A0A9Q1IEN7_SYNKA|nr:hypothetical protein SKAU_G00357990 [Synaphobranchus kaupii]
MSQAEISTCSAPQRVFQEAVKNGNTKELHSLLQNMTNCEFNVNSFGPEGQTALHQSVIDGNLELVKLLVKFGADIRLANREGWSALHIAAFGGHQDIVLYLITKAKYSSGARCTLCHLCFVCGLVWLGIAERDTRDCGLSVYLEKQKRLTLRTRLV